MSNLSLDYYFAIEDDIRRIGRYIELCEDNYPTYSLELARLLMAICSEIEVTYREICKLIDPANAPKTIDDICRIIMSRSWFKNIYYVRIPSKRLEFQPWLNWSVGNPPFWWTSYNRVKHNRFINYKDANLKNVLYAFCGYGLVIGFCGKYIKGQNFRGDFLDLNLRIFDFTAP